MCSKQRSTSSNRHRPHFTNLKIVPVNRRHKIVDTPEEQAHRRQVLRTANTESRKAHQKVERDLTNKIYLQQEAIKALPVEMQADAKMIDQTPYPMDRPWPRWDTPPIPGFNPLDYADKKKDSEENA